MGLPTGSLVQDHGSWRKVAGDVQVQLEYNRLRMANLEMLERWGSKAWIANSFMVRKMERGLAEEVAGLKSEREETNKKRKLDQVSCGNELRRLGHEFDSYARDNAEVEPALRLMEENVLRLRAICKDRGVKVGDEGDDDGTQAKVPVERTEGKDEQFGKEGDESKGDDSKDAGEKREAAAEDSAGEASAKKARLESKDADEKKSADAK